MTLGMQPSIAEVVIGFKLTGPVDGGVNAWDGGGWTLDGAVSEGHSDRADGAGKGGEVSEGHFDRADGAGKGGE